MKKSILFLAFSLITILTLSAQNYDHEDFVGTWTYSRTKIRLDSDDYAKVYWKDGSSSYGTWSLGTIFGNHLNISLNDSSLRLKVLSKSRNSMTLYDEDDGRQYTFKRQGTSNDVDAAVATTVILGAALLWLLSGDSDSGSSDYSPCSVCGGRGYVTSSNCPSGCACPGCGG